MTKINRYGLSSNDWNTLIDLWVIGQNAERDRKILKRKLLAGITFDALADEFPLSKQRIEQIVYGRMTDIISHIDTVGKR